VDLHWHSKSRTLKRLFPIIVTSCILALLLFTVAGAAESSPKRLVDAKPGDCMACHAGAEPVLPEGHPATGDMTMQTCTACHGKDAVPLKSKMPTGHTHMLSGISCRVCHGDGEPSAEVEMKTCTNCHDTKTLAEVPAKGPSLPNPHNSHYGTDLDCSLCHFQHKKSGNMCLDCHSFDNVTPSPMAPLNFRSKAAGGTSKTDSGKAEEAKALQPASAETKAAAKAETKAPAKPAGAVPGCTTCHSGPEFKENFAGTKHGKLTCTSCHKGVEDISSHMQNPDKVETLSCLTCHKAVQEQEFHKGVANLSCWQCHQETHPKKPVSASADKPKASAAGGGATSVQAPSVSDCTSCHSGSGYTGDFKESAHGSLSCTSCHRGITDVSQHMKKEQKPELTSCATCHQGIDKEYKQSHHATAAGLSCLSCHGGIHAQGVKESDGDEASAIATCLKCHSDREKYVEKGHTAKYLAGNTDAATCTDCHGAHDVKGFAPDDQGVLKKREHYTAVCVSCHSADGVAGSCGVFPLAAESYGQTYHGKAMKLKGVEKSAGCADCHQAHNILPADAEGSALSQAALVETCGKCHEGFHPRFVSYVPHPDPHDPDKFLGLYLTEKFMVALLVGVFAFFWLHSLLWWRKAYAEKAALVKAGLQVKTDLPEDRARQYVRRFGLRERLMHIVLVLSFFGVVISGFPIKYPDAPWAGWLAGLMGGVAGAAMVHRVSAGVMCLLFLYTCWLSLKFLFPKFQVKGWVGRLFGPDSLFPRWKDFEDCYGMFKWFFNRGDRPKFDRWTYWEKFDFMAVFWGMFVIGLSGVVMWIPEYSSWVMPGWLINITHLAHSEEAFLAAVFIFTVHFFNNHLVPDKFPLEKNIFTGSYTLAALKHERPLEYERILKENRLEEITCDGPGTGTQLFAGVFGIASVLLGLGLTVLIFWAMFVG
jgi:cytochrome b subunit of formate dehydrogenase